MYKWGVKIITKSGAVINGCIECEHPNSTDVAKMIFEREIPSKADFFGMYTYDCKGNLLFDIFDVSAIELRPYEKIEHD